MNQEQMATLRHQLEQEDTPIDRAAVLQLLADHSSQQQAEAFWSVRAPAMNFEVIVLRQVETSARAIRAALAAVAMPMGTLGSALDDLDALRASQAAA